MKMTVSVLFTVSATTVSAVGLLLGSPTARAGDPPAPPTNCTQFRFSGVTTIDAGIIPIKFAAEGSKFDGTASLADGTPIGLKASVDGRQVNVNFTFNDKPFDLAGQVGVDGIARGTVAVRNTPWTTVGALRCLDAPADPVQPAPTRPDRDRDGLFDDDETDVYGTNPDVADTDVDGPDDGQEVFDGTDPNNPDDHL